MKGSRSVLCTSLSRPGCRAVEIPAAGAWPAAARRRGWRAGLEPSCCDLGLGFFFGGSECFLCFLSLLPVGFGPVSTLIRMGGCCCPLGFVPGMQGMQT